MFKLYNSKSGKIEEFKAIDEKEVKLYACGPTVYDNAHVGHARASLAFDVLVRRLNASGYKVNYVRNFTDIDDKIIKRASEKQMDWKDLAQKYIDSFNEDMDALSCLKPSHEPRATGYINEMIEDIQEIMNKGFAYEVEGDVYFDVPAYKTYGSLSGRQIDDQEAGARVAVDDRKKNPADFALWKAAKLGEPSWPSPWGHGRPGWHIECSTMSFRLLGPEFDIHGGGQDLIFPHHENELAQSGALGRPMARYWAHNGFVRLNNEKMSKSLGNFFTVKDVLKQFDSETLRFLLVTNHYRGPLDFSDEALVEAEKALERIYRAIEAADEFMGDTDALAFNMKHVQEFRDRYNEAMDDDLNTAKALGIVFDIVRALNKAVMAKDLEITAATYSLLKIIGDELGLWLREPKDFFKSIASFKETLISPEEIDKMIIARNEAREAKDWAKADSIRNELAAKGVALEDKAGQTSWKYSG